MPLIMKIIRLYVKNMTPSFRKSDLQSTIRLALVFFCLVLSACDQPIEYDKVLGELDVRKQSKVEYRFSPLVDEAILKIRLLRTEDYSERVAAREISESSAKEGVEIIDPRKGNLYVTICRKYAGDTQLPEASKRLSACNAALQYGFHTTSLYNEDTGKLVKRWFFPNEFDNSTLLLFNGIPKGENAKIVIETHSLDSPDNKLAAGIKKSIGYDIKFKPKYVQIVAETREWKIREKPLVDW